MEWNGISGEWRQRESGSGVPPVIDDEVEKVGLVKRT